MCEPLHDCNAEPQRRSRLNAISGRINRPNFPQELPARIARNALCQEARCPLFTSQSKGRNWTFSRKAVLTRVFSNYHSGTEIYAKVWPYFLMNLRGLYRHFELDVPPEKFSCYGSLSVVEKLMVTNVAMDSTLSTLSNECLPSWNSIRRLSEVLIHNYSQMYVILSYFFFNQKQYETIILHFIYLKIFLLSF